MNNIVQFTDSNFSSEVLNSDKPVLVDFWADWCGPCHMLAPTIKEIADDFNGQIKVGKFDVDANQLTAAQYGIRRIPTVILFKDGNEVIRLFGVRPKQELAQTIHQVLQREVSV
jgi:thioredoxin 1